ncbi:MAG: DUF1444 family protein [Phycisphaerales bacterium]|nr:DUF1444 family protein [Phycisphaerales bacterium]
MTSLSRQQFVDRVLVIIHKRFPLVKVARAAGASFSLQVNHQVISLENLYRVSRLHPDEIQRRVERWMTELLRADEGTPDRGGSFEQLRDRILPLVINTENQEITTASVISQPWMENLQISYAVDHDRTIAYVSHQQFSGWGVSLDVLHQAAMKNLINRSQGIEVHGVQDDDGSVSLVLFQTMDGYDASRILLPSLHERLKGRLGSPFVAGIPNRDIMVCFRNEPDLIRRTRYQIGADYRAMPHQITDQLLLVTADGIALYHPTKDQG